MSSKLPSDDSDQLEEENICIGHEISTASQINQLHVTENRDLCLERFAGMNCNLNRQNCHLNNIFVFMTDF